MGELEKLLQKTERNREKIKNVIETIQAEESARFDSVIYINDLQFTNEFDNLSVKFGKQSAKMGRFALKQCANKLGVPTAYINKISKSTWGVDLSAQILNKHAKNNDPQRVLIRKIGTEIRGILSDTYRRINTISIVENYLKNSLDYKTKIFDAAIDKTKIYLDVIMPKVHDIETPRNGKIKVVFGVQLRKSDYGDGNLTIRSMIINLDCFNVILGNTYYSQKHKGHKLSESTRENQSLYDDETASTNIEISRAIEYIFKPESIEQELNLISKSSAKIIDFDSYLLRLKGSKKFTENELMNLSNKLHSGKISEGVKGENTIWKFTQGLTALANTYSSTRKNKIIEIASEFLNK